MRHITILALLMLTSAVFAQRVKKVEGEFTYHAPENVTLEQAKHTALDRAMIQALADEFGAIVSLSNSTKVENKNGQSDIDFLSIGSSDVKGEWIETLGNPIYNIRYENDMLVVTCKVRGKARKIISPVIDFKARILRNGTEDKFESDQFKSGDDLYFSFQSPVAGYLAVYLVDANKQVYCLLPYLNQEDGTYKVKSKRRYLFFSIKDAILEDKEFAEEYTITCAHSSEWNQIYIIFSTNQFVKPIDDYTDTKLPRELSYGNFQNWLSKCRKHDKDMNIRIIPIQICQ